MKQRVNVTIDFDVWLFAKTNGINVSEVCNEALSCFRGEKSNKKMSTLLKDNEELDTKLKSLINQKARNTAEIARLRTEEKEVEEKTDERHEAIVKSGLLRKIE